METLARLAAADPILRATGWRLVNVLDEASVRGRGRVVNPTAATGSAPIDHQDPSLTSNVQWAGSFKLRVTLAR